MSRAKGATRTVEAEMFAAEFAGREITAEQMDEFFWKLDLYPADLDVDDPAMREKLNVERHKALAKVNAGAASEDLKIYHGIPPYQVMVVASNPTKWGMKPLPEAIIEMASNLPPVNTDTFTNRVDHVQGLIDQLKLTQPMTADERWLWDSINRDLGNLQQQYDALARVAEGEIRAVTGRIREKLTEREGPRLAGELAEASDERVAA